MTRSTTAPPIEIAATPKHLLGMTPARFLRDYWQKRPLLIRAAFPGFVPPLTPEDLAGLACEETALARLVRRDPAHDRWSVRSGPFQETDFTALPARDWTVLVQDVDKWDADVAALLPRFDFLPRWRIDDVMVSYAAPGGSVGAHVDQYDVFLLQGLGRRRWQIDARPHPEVAFRDDVELRLLQHFDPSHAWDLAPGDMLYLPPGVPHHGVALEACLTFSVGMRAPSCAELLVDFAEQLAESLPESQRYADPDLLPPRDAGEIDAATLRRVAAALPWLRIGSTVAGAEDHPACTMAQLRTLFGRFITRYRSAGEVAPPPRLPSPAQLERLLQQGGRVLRHPFARVAWSRAGRAAELYVDGEVHTCRVATAQRLCADAPLDAGALHAMDARGRALIHTLLQRGTLVAVPASRRRR